MPSEAAEVFHGVPISMPRSRQDAVAELRGSVVQLDARYGARQVGGGGRERRSHSPAGDEAVEPAQVIATTEPG